MIDAFQKWAISYAPKIAAAMAIVIIGLLVTVWIKRVVMRLMRKARIDAMLVSFVGSLTYFALLLFLLIAALSTLGVPTTSLVAVLGAAGVAVALALQGSLSNFASGILIIVLKPFKADDFIETNGIKGVVDEIGIFNTILKTADNKRVIIPNSKVTGDNTVNYTTFGQRRVDMTIAVGYDDDIDRAEEILNEILAADERILKDPAPTVGLMKLAESSINFVVRPWVKNADYFGVLCDTQKSIKRRFDDAGITIPFPRQDIHLYDENKS
jgi:small conductance mechanosensitive channel